ncbi:hypothetical protein KO493_13395 [Tamlana agarivorans]|uniref:Uncharacterized protein n=1 Tax=Pseudotamlana agarivorans TaxID=481183 RepID=A0ACC5UBR5_9FLAO|nr:hypothetical protein [Tamlana agarivorans]MBU2951694.1 hypothetical protein [Tamlana agarivorans]
MFKLLFKNLLLADYSVSKWLVNKKMPERILPSTLHFFATPFTFIIGALYFVVIGSIKYRFESYLPILIGLVVVMLPFQLFIEKKAKRAIYQWQIEKEYKTLTKNQRWNKNTFGFIFFWSAFGVSFYLIVKFVGGYLVQ